jgi:F-type H+-transporting ATPase subunit O
MNKADDDVLQYTAAAKSSALEPTSKALAGLGEVLKRDTKLPLIIAAPTLTSDDKSQIIQELQKHTGAPDKDGIVKNLLQTLANNNRLGILEGICDKFAVLMGASRGEIEMTVTSAAVRQPQHYPKTCMLI